MKTLRVASLDFRGKAWLLGLASLLGLLVWVQPWILPGFLPHRSGSPAEARAAFAGVFALGTVVASSLLLGASLWASDLQEGRMSFFLARPLRSHHLFLGRFVSAIGLVLMCGLLAYTPALFYLKAAREALDSLGFLAGLSVWILLMAHLASISLRARTSWILLDLASLGLVGAILLACMDMAISFLWTAGETQGLALASFLGGLLVLGAGAYAALVSGRVSLPRAHRALSITVFAGMSLVWVAGAAVREGLLRVGPADIPAVAGASGGAQGPWLAVRYRASLDARFTGKAGNALYNTATQRGFRLPTDEVTFSRDGRLAVWWQFRLSPFGGGVTLRRANLAAEAATVEDTGIRLDLEGEASTYASDLALSEDGSRVASRSGGWLVVHDLRTGAQLLRQILPGVGSGMVAGQGGLRFLDAEHLRVYAPGLEPRAPLGIFEVDLAKGRVARTGSLEEAAFRPIRAMDRSASRLVLERIEGAERVLELRDARTGLLVAPLSRGTREPRALVSFLGDGSLLLLVADPHQAVLSRFDPEGRLRWETALPAPSGGKAVFPVLDSDAGPDAAKVSLHPGWTSAPGAPSTFRIDLREGHATPDPDPVPLRSAHGPDRWRRPESSAVFYRSFGITEAGTLVRIGAKGSSEWVLGPR